ncbi:LacI family DNA-binding transcriptional regulator [Ruficoccus sp. ZRK36]|uniref:LacI family DNA-binding transcriptional regulator n=1 Tax=Ruficoccus sp. ZRK36 TaxID=2866311 RepID=UPI001C739ABD|nr:LacI family DNA-binding transcriptional regulator [Ruficoccus sp. ZRK36]QYY35213.1 LacI family transcriptional regulator [Ruficoccus sp. ZRK36]
MDKPRRNPTLKDIAEHTGFGRSTISLALRDSPSLPEKTRRIIQNAAKELGYRPNPLFSALMTRVRQRSQSIKENIALVTRLSEHPRNSSNKFFSILYEAISTQAERHGLGTEVFTYEPATPLPDQRLSQILLARGIRGLILFPGGSGSRKEYPELKWEEFATVLVGFGTRRESIHRVAADYMYDMDYAIRRSEAVGGKRIGLVLQTATDNLTDNAWFSRYLFYQSQLPAKQRLKPFFNKESVSASKQSLLRWYNQERPDVVISSDRYLIGAFRDVGVRIPQDLRAINLTKHEQDDSLAGIDPVTHEVGYAAVDLLLSLMQTNQIGIPQHPRTLTVKGAWSPGKSFPE